LGDRRSVYRTLFAAYPDALIVADTKGRIQLANPSAAMLLGYSVEELLTLHVDDLVPHAIRPAHAAYREAYRRNPRPRPMGMQMDLSARRKDGSEVQVEISLSPLQDHALPLVVAAIRDIGDYPRVKQALQRAVCSEHLARIGRLASMRAIRKPSSSTCRRPPQRCCTSKWPSSTCSRATGSSCA